MGDIERVELRLASSLIFFDNITILPASSTRETKIAARTPHPTLGGSLFCGSTSVVLFECRYYVSCSNRSESDEGLTHLVLGGPVPNKLSIVGIIERGISIGLVVKLLVRLEFQQDLRGYADDVARR